LDRPQAISVSNREHTSTRIATAMAAAASVQVLKTKADIALKHEKAGRR
jgi:hypothetical protein